MEDQRLQVPMSNILRTRRITQIGVVVVCNTR